MLKGQFVGNASDPKILLDQLTYPLESLVESIEYVLKSGEFITILVDQLNWTRSVYLLYGLCYSLHTPKEIKEKGIRDVAIYLKQNVLVFVHSHGIWKRSALTQAQLPGTMGKPSMAKISYTVYHLLDYHDERCDNSDSYSLDDCFFCQVDNKLLQEIGCTTPFGISTDKICRNQTLGYNAFKIFELSHMIDGSFGCKHPCSYVKVATEMKELTKEAAETSNGVFLTFEDEVTVVKAQYTYSILSLFAEVGSYIGLFLGYSVYQLSSYLNVMLSKLYKP